ncbi:hypothetical protein ACQP1P_09175 [Dactylosporangium sp. CA-052675]|uniref:hypothetical protein n=1 Tax=Dactylosporangium sp. CA-052675 TaxID=3239927 RepID=UPI003D919269
MTAPDDEDEALLAELRRVFAALDARPAAPPPAAAPPAARPPRARAAGRAPAPPGDPSGSPDGARPAPSGPDAPGPAGQPGAGRGRLAWDDFELRRPASGRAGQQHRPAPAAERGRSLPPVKDSQAPERRPGPPAP